MSWYYILFFSVFTVFVIKTVLTWVFGDIDIDFDADGDVDFDVSSMLSFKGVLHFLLGFSTYLASTAKMNSQNLELFSSDYSFSTPEYLMAVLVGVIFTVVLWYIYKSMMLLNHSESSNPEFDNCKCVVNSNCGDGKYVVLINTFSGTYKKTLSHVDLKNDIDIGTEMKVTKKDGEYVIV